MNFRTRFFSDDLPLSSPYGTSHFGSHADGFSYQPTLRRNRHSISLISFRSPSPHGANVLWWCRNVDLLSIDYAFRPRLRDRLTLGGMTFPRKPSAYGERDSHSLYRYSSRHNHLDIVQASLPSPFTRSSNASLPMGPFTGHIPELRFLA